MDTLARHPLTSLAAVGVLVALALHFGIKPPPPPPAAGGTIYPVAASLGEQAEVTGRVTAVATRPAAMPAGPAIQWLLVLDLGRGEAVCAFPAPEDIAGVRVGDAVTVGGRVNGIEDGRVHLGDCKLVAAPKP